MLDALLNSNDYLLGKQHGFSDGIDGKPKNYVRMGLTARGIIHGQKAYDTYVSGYDSGYEFGSSLSLVGLDKKATAKHSTSIKSLLTLNSERPMTQVFDRQIELLESLKIFLANYCEQLEESISTLGNYLEELDSEGLDGSLLEKYQEYYETQKVELTALKQEIEDEEIPYTERVIDHLSDMP